MASPYPAPFRAREMDIAPALAEPMVPPIHTFPTGHLHPRSHSTRHSEPQVTMPSGGISRHRPRVKSGIPTGMLPVATERAESSMMLLQAAAS